MKVSRYLDKDVSALMGSGAAVAMIIKQINLHGGGGGAVASVFGRTGVVVATSGDYNTSLVTENTNLYFTNARVILAPITGFISGSGVLGATDTILQAIQKLDGNIGANTTSIGTKQPQLNGTGFIKATGTSISYDNSTYVTAVSVASSNGFTGSSSGGATPALTLTTSITGLLKGNGTAISAASSGTDYSAGTSGLATGILKSTITTGALSIAVAGDFPTLNQNTTGSAGSISASNVITNSNLSTMAANTLKGNNTGSPANAADLTVANVVTLLSAVQTTRTLNIGGASFDLTANRTWSIGVSLPGQITQRTSDSGAINTTETAILTSPTIAANQFTAGSSYRVIVYGTCTSTVANASNFRLRVGTNGTTGDNVVAIVTPTSAASGTNIPFFAEFHFTIRTTGSGGTAGGNGYLNNTGVTGVSAATPVVGAPQTGITVNTTITNIITLWYVSAATTTTSTFQVGWIECVKV